MVDTLEGLVGEVAHTIPTAITPGGIGTDFSADTLPVPPTHLTTKHLYVEKGISEYDECFVIDMVTFYGHKVTLKHLALLILAVVFHPEPAEVRLQLTHPASEVTTLIVACEGQPFDRWLGTLRTQAVSFTCLPGEVRRFPWSDQPLSPDELPRFCLRSDPSRRYSSHDEERRERDIVAGFGSDRGCVRLAEVLLNLSRPENTEPEIRLESEAGWRGVGRNSNEARFVRPGNIMWNPAQWPSPGPEPLLSSD